MCVFGYPEYQKGYNCFDPVTKRCTSLLMLSSMKLSSHESDSKSQSLSLVYFIQLPRSHSQPRTIYNVIHRPLDNSSPISNPSPVISTSIDPCTSESICDCDPIIGASISINASDSFHLFTTSNVNFNTNSPISCLARPSIYLVLYLCLVKPKILSSSFELSIYPSCKQSLLFDIVFPIVFGSSLPILHLESVKC